LVDVHAASVSYMDYLMVCGGYQMRPTLPYVPGTDAAGVVVACGGNVKHLHPGDRVACGGWFGSFAERMTAKASNSARLPENADFIVGSTILHGYVTAWYALVERARLQAGETVLVTGAAGGVGLACVELAHLLGARVIAAVGSAAKASVVREYGADEIIDYSGQDLRERVKALTGGEGLDVCVENVGGTLFTTLARLMRWNGRLMPIGFTSGEIPSLAMNLPLLKNYSIVGVFTGAWGERFPDEKARAADMIMAWVGEGKLHPRIDHVLPLEQAADAMTAIADRSVQGRIVLRVR
jgi:NADPH2:quinone reductase